MTSAEQLPPALVHPRPASTVMLIRDSPVGLQVFLLERVSEMAFAPGMTVFPGGAVDPSDYEGTIPYVGPPQQWWSSALGLGPAEAMAAVSAAMRELYEESGVLLLADGQNPSSTPDISLRVALDRHELSWAQFLTDHTFQVDGNLIRPWSRWVTPAQHSRRYDTYFFIAVLPAGQEADAATSEALHGHWSTPEVALARGAAGEIKVMRPTAAVLTELSAYRTAAEAMAATVGESTTVLSTEYPPAGYRLLGSRVPVRTSPCSQVILAPNPSPMTLDGTNTYILAAPDAQTVVIVDPGPTDPTHLRSLTECGQVELVLITHRHPDHTAGSAALHAATGAPVRAWDPEFCHGGEPLRPGEIVHAAGLRIEVVATPGHSSDSVSFLIADDGPTGSVLTGDTILGRGTTVLAYPDGSLKDYLASLDRLSELGPRLVLPAHGPVLPDLSRVTADYRVHRVARLDQVRAAVHSLTAAGGLHPASRLNHPDTEDHNGSQDGDHDRLAELTTAVTTAVYFDVPANVQAAAQKSVSAQLEYLIDVGELDLTYLGRNS